MRRDQIAAELERTARYIRTNRPMTRQMHDGLAHCVRVCEDLVPAEEAKPESVVESTANTTANTTAGAPETGSRKTSGKKTAKKAAKKAAKKKTAKKG